MTVNHIFILFLASFTAHVNIHFFRIFVASIQPLGKVLSMAFPQDSDQQVRSISVVAHRARMASETMNDAPWNQWRISPIPPVIHGKTVKIMGVYLQWLYFKYTFFNIGETQ